MNAAPKHIPPQLSAPQLGPPQFGLRTLLLIVSSVAVLLGLSQWLSPISVAALMLLTLSIIAHVAGNVIGSRLRDGRSRSRDKQEQPPHVTSLRDDHFAPVTKLGRRHPLGWIPLLSALGGFCFGSLLGGSWTAYLLRQDFDWFPVAIAACAFGALGGFGGFLIIGFCKAFWDAWQEASSAAPAPDSEGER